MKNKFKNLNPALESKINTEYRKVVLKAFSNKCCSCGSKEKLIASRIIKDRKKPYLTYDVRNAQLLCVDCRKVTKRDIRKPYQKRILKNKYEKILKSEGSYLRSAYIRRIQRYEMTTGREVIYAPPKKKPVVIRRKSASVATTKN